MIMRRHTVILITVLVLAVFLAGCGKKPPAEVNGVPITEKVLQWHLKQKMGEHQAAGAAAGAAALRQAVLQQLVSEKLMLEGAREKNMTASAEEVSREVAYLKQRYGEAEFKKSLSEVSMSEAEFGEMLREKIIVQKFVTSLASPDSITDEAVREYYQGSSTPFLNPETVNLRFIQLNDMEQAEKIMKELGAGKESFDKLADRLGGEKAAVVSNYGWTNPGMFKAEIAEGLKSIDVGGYGGPYAGTQGYYIFRIKERQVDRIKTLEEATAEIRAVMLDRKRQAAIAHWLAQKGKSAKVVINKK